MVALTPRQMVAETLRDGRRWARSFQAFKSVVDAMVADGEVHRVAPENGKPRNMIELTGRGWYGYFGENLLVSRVDRFAELVSEGFEPVDAGRQLFLTTGETAAAWRDIKKHLGAQAA